ncbi:hypothetical protein MBEBAB_2106 [Brevundimonas abyssalis TAR-001]|uniref:Uncharacterized protein n=1 Tax=Brevundimonas abyssalis TAR-001 TaxID=1391729 RepID=A0A8E0NCN5_9CAUL|nr:hypothetical protein MBEBAB_2106 [Brevundimonas abyssalis TAR-001]
MNRKDRPPLPPPRRITAGYVLAVAAVWAAVLYALMGGG